MSVGDYSAVIQPHELSFFFMMNLASVYHTQLFFARSILQKHAPATHVQLPGK